MAEPLLYDLGRKLKPAILGPAEAPAGIEVAQHMQPGIFRPALLGHDTGRNLNRNKAAVDDVAVVLDIPKAVREHQILLALWTCKLPFTQSIKRQRRQRDRSLAGFGLWLSDLVVAVGPLMHPEFTLFEINIGPAQPANFGSAQPGEDGGQQQRPPTAIEPADNRLDFFAGRDVDTDFELTLLT